MNHCSRTAAVARDCSINVLFTLEQLLNHFSPQGGTVFKVKVNVPMCNRYHRLCKTQRKTNGKVICSSVKVIFSEDRQLLEHSRNSLGRALLFTQ